ncbi:MAG: 4a-hydroxytetrahydrobiopterin dehydratase [Gammaproteobacteria bacterium]|nr:4a-hydroxytetrahydrobiopterin dehydratase [Gammaproteobacteria bacterium]MBT8445183.1 4a-hydroxytetrahydrobiopterin dehydratase [Gammaproteobacteria bacterium]NND36872.1 4a-hydroxytetrahydrobiopterin dehydratase [Gammaproteobacteria bacterium]
MTKSSDLVKRRCKPCEGGVPPLEPDAAQELMNALNRNWSIADDGRSIVRLFEFAGYHRTISFVNAVAWIAESEGHHPDLTVGYGKVNVLFTTYAIGGLSENDFICAAKIDRLLE